MVGYTCICFGDLDEGNAIRDRGFLPSPLDKDLEDEISIPMKTIYNEIENAEIIPRASAQPWVP